MENVFTMENTGIGFLNLRSMKRKQRIREGLKSIKWHRGQLFPMNFHRRYQNGSRKKRLSFGNNVKFNEIPHAALLPTSGETGMMCTFNGE